MKQYICTVAAVAIIAALSDILIPKTWQKYTAILTGSILLITLISPLLRLRGITPPQISFPEIEIREYSVTDEIEAKLKLQVEEDINKRIKNEFNVSVDADINIIVSDGKIMGISEIYLYSKEVPGIAERLREVYGCQNIIWRQKKNEN